LVCALGGLLYLPFLGSTGLWDPWEPHYAEVAREMVESGNWIEPTWEHSPGQSLENRYFFSKPALALWMMAVPMKIFGIHASNGSIIAGAEWYLRLPFALTAILGLLGVFALANRFFGPTVGLLSALILGTCPQYTFIARQAMTDMPMVGLMTAAFALLLIGGFDSDRPNPPALYGGYVLLGLSVIAKGLIGFFLPGLVFLVYFVISGDWKRLQRMRIPSGGILALLVAAPWFVYLSIASLLRGLQDDEGKTFFERFFLHDHLYRMGSGVHGDRGTFAYFIEQLGLGSHPWFPVMVWGSVRTAMRLDRTELNREDRVELFVFLWALSGFCFYSLSMTKFHHYTLPILPALSILAALWLTRAFKEPEIIGQKIAPLLLVLGIILISRDIGLTPKGMTDLFVYNYTREFPKDAALPGQLGYSVIFGLMSIVLTAAFLFYGRRVLMRFLPGILAVGGFLGAIWSGWYFYGAMGPHWSQRHLFDTYYALRGPEDPVGAYLMNWRGETFYSRNSVTQLKDNNRLKNFLSSQKGKRVFLLVEQNRLQKLRDQLSSELNKTLRVLDRTCNKFFLVSVDNSVESSTNESAPASPPSLEQSEGPQ
jgi:4-amino-4-deoxy-L-arabinose transferase-like glycosyltransferase